MILGSPFFDIKDVAKGQIISKGFLVSLISSKKLTKQFDFTFVRFFEEIEDTKKPFRIYLTFR